MRKKHIVCFGDSNTWGYDALTGGRFDEDTRWTQLLQRHLGKDYLVLEEGVSGRTTAFDDPRFEGLCGRRALPVAMMTHCPVDCLVVMLGTNDCKALFSASVRHINDGLRRLIHAVKYQRDVWADAPRILIVAPIIMDEGLYSVPDIFQEMGENSVEKSRALPAAFEQTAKVFGCDYMDCNPYVTPNTVDFMHLDSESHARLAKAVAEKLREMRV